MQLLKWINRRPGVLLEFDLLAPGDRVLVGLNLTAAMRADSRAERWPPGPDRNSMSKKVADFWRGTRQESGGNKRNIE